MAKQPNNRVSFNNICSIQQYDVDQEKLRDEPKNETKTDTEGFFDNIKRKSQSHAMIKTEIPSNVRSQADQKKDEDSLAGFLSFTGSPKLQQDDARETMPAITPEKFYLEHTERKFLTPMRDSLVQKDENQIRAMPFKSETPYRAFPQSAVKDQCETLRKGAKVTHAITLNGSICSNSEEMDFIQEQNSQVSPAKMEENLNQTVEMKNEFNEDSLSDTIILKSASESISIKLGETAAKLTEIEDKLANREVTIGFKQILAEVKLNRSIKQEVTPKVESSRCPPLKQARYSVNESPKSNSIAIPTVLARTPTKNVKKAQQFKPSNNLQALSASRNPRRQTLQAPQDNKTLVTEIFDSNPMNGPIPLKSFKNIIWTQELCHDPNWLDEVRPPRWTPLPYNHFDLHGPTAGMEKDELRQKAEKLVIQTINKFEGEMEFVRKDLFTKGTRIMKQAAPFKKQMLELKKKHDKLIEHHNKRVDHYNYLIEHLREKRHAENERFITDVKNKVQNLMSEWATS